VILRWELTGGDGGSLSSLDLSEAVASRSGDSAELRLTLWSDSCIKWEHVPVPGKPGLYALGERYRSKLEKRVFLTVRLDMAGVHALAVRAARSRGGKARSGPVSVRGGKRAQFKRVAPDAHPAPQGPWERSEP
jgi:hypothetical protein